MERAHERPALAALGSAKYRPAFNLFRHKLKPHLVFAVPEDYPVPRFIEGGTWEFAGKVSEPTTAPPGFNRKAAEAGVRFNGFYLFQTSLIENSRITVEPRREPTQRVSALPWMPDQRAIISLAEQTNFERTGTIAVL
jgi:hypothetical protein